MAKDADDDPFQVAGSPEVVLTCADCGEVGPIFGTRSVPGVNQPDDPLCEEDFQIAARVWHGTPEFNRLHLLGKPVITSFERHKDGDPGYRRLCPRCNGTGRAPSGYEGLCFECRGVRWTYVFQRDVRRTARWSQTFQQNRTP